MTTEDRLKEIRERAEKAAPADSYYITREDIPFLLDLVASTRAQLQASEAANAAMREALMQIAHGMPTEEESFVDFVDRISRDAYKSTKAGADLLEALQAFREGWEAWERAFSEQTTWHLRRRDDESLKAARARISSLPARWRR